MIVRRSKKDYIEFPYTNYRKAAVVKRFNEFHKDHKYEELDWGELFAELIEAYVNEEPLHSKRSSEPVYDFDGYLIGINILGDVS